MFYDAYEKPDLKDLEHYGVLGMKWGVRKDPSKAYRKASTKASKLKKKYIKRSSKAAVSQNVAMKKMSRATNERKYRKAIRYQTRAARRNLTAAKTQKRLYKWEQKMKETFKDVKLSDIKQEDLDYGREYVSYLFDDTRRKKGG